MPLDIGALRRDGVSALVTWADEDFLVRYHPTKHTSEMQQRLEAADGEESANLILNELVFDWDITDGPDKVPCNPDVVASLPLGLKLAIVQGVLQDLVNPTTGATKRGAPVLTVISSNGSHSAEPPVQPSGPSASQSGTGFVG